MKMMIGSILAVFVIVFSFQNCQKAPHADEVVPTNQPTISKIDLKSEKLSRIDLNFTETETVTRPQGSYSQIVNKAMQIDIGTGEFSVVVTYNNALLQNYCLTENLRNELVSILKSSQVCKTVFPPISSELACSQVVIPPYAVLRTDVGVYKLGGASSPCSSAARIDLCDDQGQFLKGFIAALKNNYKTLSCAQ